ncbi:hypothetical protein C2G38_2225157 [Gigaspora rosea]|uniref:BTB domain-containing protein n=1 Tax=Gigaspora rosea TaxID=44941 RepID=A0A397TZF4_9GLOM|nr:hypothetical protein C2G38_2225157 [Gigaspora rosea]
MSQISTKLLEHFSNDFVQLFKTEYDYNVIVKVGSQNVKLHSLFYINVPHFFVGNYQPQPKRIILLKLLNSYFVESFKILIKLWPKILKLELRNVINAWVEYWSFKIQNIFTSYYMPNTIPGVELSTIFDLLVPSNKLDLAELQDDLRIEKSEIWNKVIQRGKEQTPNLPSNFE